MISASRTGPGVAATANAAAIANSAVIARSVAVAVIALSTGTVPGYAGAQQPRLRAAQPMTISPAADDLYVIAGEGGNVAVLVSERGVLLVDDMFERNHADIVAAVAAVTDEPVRYVVNTHQHDDHAGGDRLFLPIASVIAHDNVRTNLKAIKQPYYEDTPGLPVGLPAMTFPKSLVVYLGTQPVAAHHFGRGHTNGDAIVHFPAQRTIHTGDLFIARGSLNIYADYAQGGSLLDWVDTIDAVLTLDFDTVIPGHGPLATREDVATFRDNLAAMIERLAALLDAGASREQLAAVLEADYGWRATGCPPSPPTPGCLQFQQLDALIEEFAQR